MTQSSVRPARLQVAEHLLDPSRPGVEAVETHVSTVVFDGDLVHKRKKPVHFPFVDLSTPELRRQMCCWEVVLNRRFSPDVYLGVEDVVDDRGHVVDCAVRMRRLPAERRLATLVRERRDVSRCLRAIARQMAACHAGAVRSDDISSVATRDALLDLWTQNLRELEAFVPHPLDPSMLAKVDDLAHRYLVGRSALLDERIARGRIVDGHGDLLAQDIFCLDDGPRLLDGLEFDDRLRWGDVLYDIGFLAMDLEHLGRPELAVSLLDWYREFSGETHPASLEHHYVAYRALVRSKIACLRGRPDDEVEARAFLAQCYRHLLDARVQLVVIGGLPGTGKTTLAAALGDELGWPVVRSDETRKELAGLDTREHVPAAYGEALYTATMTEATYDTLFTRARQLLARGESVILDASFSKERWRAAASALAGECAADLTELRCLLPANVAAARLVNRAAAGDDASDATPLVAAAMALEFDEWPNAVTVGTLPPVEDVIPAVLDRIDGAPPSTLRLVQPAGLTRMAAARSPARRGDGRATSALLGATSTMLAAGGVAQVAGASAAANALWAAATVLGLGPAIWWVGSSLRHGRLGVDVIAVLALLGTLAVGEHLAGAVIAVMLATGRTLEARATARARSDMRALRERVPRAVHRVEGQELTSPALEDIAPGDLLLVQPGEIVPVDGRVEGDVAVLDESALTGEGTPRRASGRRGRAQRHRQRR